MSEEALIKSGYPHLCTHLFAPAPAVYLAPPQRGTNGACTHWQLGTDRGLPSDRETLDVSVGCPFSP